jgi:F0F1-type ATP synthase gamma subunit
MALLAWLFFRPVREALEKGRAAIEGEQRASRAAAARAVPPRSGSRGAQARGRAAPHGRAGDRRRELEAGAERDIARGRLLRALLRQPRLTPRGTGEEMLAVLAVSGGWLDGLAPAQAPGLVERLRVRLRAEAPGLAAALERGEPPDEAALERLRALAATLRGTPAEPEAAPLRGAPAEGAPREPLGAARAYRDEVSQCLGVLDGRAQPAPGPAGIVLIAADLGLVGDYAARLVREALALREERGAGPLVCLRQRALAPLARGGVTPVSLQPSPTSVAGLAAVLLPLVDTLVSLAAKGGLGSLWLVTARFEGAGRYAPMRVPVLPVPAPAGGAALPPSPYGDAAHLRTVVLREYLYASLFLTLLEALASEHGKRLATAESARSWLAERMEATRRLGASLRRELSTQEVLEVAVAARAPRVRS